MKLSEELDARGFINQFSTETLSEIFDGQKRTVYHGIDPTADSAHAGNFVVWVLLRHLVNHGHKVIFLVGGGTGMIGDPKPDVERPLSQPEEVAARVEKLKSQAQQLLGEQEVEFTNNFDWLSTINLITFLRDIGKHFTVNELIKKDAIAKRLSSENGISYTEFAYPLLQAYDFLTLYRQKGCDVQVGGSDQWGNIIAGVDLIRRVEQKTAYAVTVPLIIDKATGKKFGKSEGNAVWLDAEKTSPYAFYQFWLNTSDESVIEYLKLFTFIPLEEIAEIEKDFRTNPGSRSAQKRLAKEVTEFVHGHETMLLVQEVSDILFGDISVKDISVTGKELLLKNAPSHKVNKEKLLIDVLVECGLASSKREARTFIESGAVSMNGDRIETIEETISDGTFFSGISLLRRGKKQFCVLELR